MSWFETSLTRLERRLRELVEGDAAADGFPSRLHHQLERLLVSAMQSGMQEAVEVSVDGKKPPAPDEYTLLLPASAAELLLNHPGEMDRLARYLASYADQSGFRLAEPPTLHVVADPGTEKNRAVASYSRAGLDNTSTSVIDGKDDASQQAAQVGMARTFLIVNGLATYALTRTVINIGRDASNHIQVDDPRVSRLHAQMRLIRGRYVIFDLDSTGGTAVNGISVTSHALNPGDVISLAGVPLVYGQEQGSMDGYTQEVPTSPPPPGSL